MERRSEAVTVVEAVVGWTYFFLWSISYYFQVHLNWRRKSTHGFSLEFLLLNLSGVSVCLCLCSGVPSALLLVVAPLTGGSLCVLTPHTGYLMYTGGWSCV